MEVGLYEASKSSRDKTTENLYLDMLSMLFPQFHLEKHPYLSRLTSDAAPFGKAFLSSLSSPTIPTPDPLPPPLWLYTTCHLV